MFRGEDNITEIRYSRLNKFNERKRYAPTLTDGSKGKAIRTEVPSIQDAREIRLKELGII